MPDESELLRGEPFADVASDAQLQPYRDRVREIQREMTGAINAFWEAWLPSSDRRPVPPSAGPDVGPAGPAA